MEKHNKRTNLDIHLAEVYQFFYNDSLPIIETQAIQDRMVNRAAAIQDFVNSPPIPFVLPVQKQQLTQYCNDINITIKEFLDASQSSLYSKSQQVAMDSQVILEIQDQEVKSSTQDTSYPHCTRSQKQFWSEEQIQMLNELKQQDSNLSYKNLARILNDKFATNLKSNQVHQRWQRVQNPEIHKGKWSADEDAALVEAVKINKNLTYLSKQLPQRSSFQIKNRCNCLNLKVNQ
ncbi:Myb-like DNA-binding domain-containing protein [Spironucleus salmonicida]|uniref:Myb-like DNA-binding domain-containing protein n=1 Tax=Spironucleus salmonicida TaxID=348837 RepID=V6LVA6_9EUKA|nr:Myb-like DNA-binding domain-containing protein [Spironucleus salmonicida]|eukprot:EST48577.1 Myb-like DNA-binding domain-containing protein [Spironucleus salmonicida]